MPRITFSDVQKNLGNTEVYNIINAIRNDNPNFKQYVPLANADNVAEIGQAITVNSTTMNDFITTLVDRIAFTIIRNVTLENPLKKFKKGRVELGKIIQEIFVDLTKEKQFDPDEAEDTVFKREIPNVSALYHERNRQGRYDQTISEDQLKTAFTSWNTFGDFLSGIINAIYNSAEVDEYRYTKLLLDNAYSKGKMTVVPTVAVDSQTTASEFIKQVRATFTKLTLPFGSRDYNSMAVHTRSFPDSLHLFVSADLMATVDVDVLARAFNMSKTDFLGNVTIIDEFASEGLQAVMIDEQFLQIYDNNVQMRTIYNPKGLYWNYFYHVWQTYSISNFSNAVAFVTGPVDPVTQTVVTPGLSSVKAGGDIEFKSFIRTTDRAYKQGDVASLADKTYTAEWKVEGYNGTVVDGDTQIDQNGKLVLGEQQTGDLKVVLTVTFEVESTEGEEPTTTKESIGEALVNVVPVV